MEGGPGPHSELEGDAFVGPPASLARAGKLGAGEGGGRWVGWEAAALDHQRNPDGQGSKHREHQAGLQRHVGAEPPIEPGDGACGGHGYRLGLPEQQLPHELGAFGFHKGRVGRRWRHGAPADVPPALEDAPSEPPAARFEDPVPCPEEQSERPVGQRAREPVRRQRQRPPARPRPLPREWEPIPTVRTHVSG